MAIVSALQGESLDALIWRVNGGGPAAVEAALAANHGLAAIAIALPEHHPVLLPDAAPAAAEIELVNLWD